MLKKIIANSGIQLIGKAIGLVTSLLITALITRKLGPSNYGLYVFLFAFINLMVSFGNWGTQIIGVRELAKSKDKGGVFGSLFSLRLILACLITFLSLVIVGSFKIFSDLRLISLISLPLIVAIIVESSFEVVFLSFVKMGIKAKISVFSSLLFLLLTYLFLKTNLGLLSPILGWYGSKIFSILLSFFAFKKLIPGKHRVDKKVVGHLIRESLPVGALLILFSVYDQAIDSLVIKNYLGPAQVGLYGLAYKIYGNLVLPAYFLSNSIFPILSKNPEKDFTKLLKIGLSLSCLTVLFLIPAVFFLGKPAVLLIAGRDFAGSAVILRILVPALLFSYLNHLFGFSLIALNRQTDSLKIGLLALFWNLILNLYFIPRTGIIAAAWITVSTEALVTILSFSVLFLKKSGSRADPVFKA
ncbi:MAG: flippase [Patescibacteria group bacterium]|nr:flippase [Patescibacteria group bacterium]